MRMKASSDNSNYKEKYLLFFHSREFSKPLLPVGRAGVLLAEILHLLCKQMVSVRVYRSQAGAGCSECMFMCEAYTFPT